MGIAVNFCKHAMAAHYVEPLSSAEAFELKGWFPLQPYRTETYRISLFPSTRVELMVSTQKKILRYVTIRLKWKPAFIQKISIIGMRYTAKNYDLFKVVENRMQQCCAAHIVHSCQQYCSALLSLIAG